MSKITTKTEVLRHRIATEVFGEVDDGDGIREYSSWEIFEKCLEQQEKIKELKHRLSNCIEPKFKVGQIVWHCYKNCNAPVKTVIESIDIEVNKEFVDFTYYDVAGFGFDEIMLFTTEAEAKKHLEELKNE